MEKGKKVIIHDLPLDLANQIFDSLSSDYVVFDANLNAARCVGCFECWLKKPGVCKFSDRLEHVGAYILSSERFIIISTMLYGGVSIPIKRILDRSIPGITPFFKKRFGKLHHLRRYQTNTEITAYYYNVQNNTEEEKKHGKEYIDAMGINYYSKKNEVFYIDGIDLIEVKI